ncbi:MAG: cytochrome c oxidase accessory protein CcoG [Pseudomonadota bacterium]
MSSPEDLIGEEQSFFEARRKVFPKAVNGTYRRLKWAVMAVTLTIYYVTPWLRWNRGPYAPDQAVLVDLAHRRFYMFSIEIWPHEFYYVAGLLIMAGVGLFLVTSAVGRAWCGYACPQTVWTDLFVHVERAIDGDRNAQIRLQRAPWGPVKIAKRVFKHASWLVIGALTGGAWIFYFADAPALGHAFIHGTAPYVAYATVAVLTATTYIFGGLMREQVCIYMCPWPRIQSAMLDEKSLTVTYKAWRGEPRSHGLKRADAAQEGVPSLVGLAEGSRQIGDCIDCNACVAVCPTGIDIREGPQIGCITCGLCIDACDQIMTKVDRPTRLIGYTTDLDGRLATAGKTPLPALKRLLRPRTLVYFSVWAGIGLVMLFALGNRTRIDISVLQTRNPQWVRLSDGHIRNSYTVKVRNMEERPRSVEIAVAGMPDAVMWSEAADRSRATKSMRLEVAPDQVAQAQIFVVAGGDGPARTDLTFIVRALDAEGGSARDKSFFERPEKLP